MHANPKVEIETDALKQQFAEAYAVSADDAETRAFFSPGRVNLILPPPAGASSPTNVILAGPNNQTLYVTCGGKVFKRKTKLTAAKPWAEPVKPPKPRL